MLGTFSPEFSYIRAYHECLIIENISLCHCEHFSLPVISDSLPNAHSLLDPAIGFRSPSDYNYSSKAQMRLDPLNLGLSITKARATTPLAKGPPRTWSAVY